MGNLPITQELIISSHLHLGGVESFPVGIWVKSFLEQLVLVPVILKLLEKRSVTNGYVKSVLASPAVPD